MKHKKLFAILTLVCFMFTLMPMAALAEEAAGSGADLKALFQTTTDKDGKEILSLNGDVTISLDKNYEIDESEDWSSIIVNGTGVLTINGNGHTITGLEAPLFSQANGGKLVINQLTIAGSSIIVDPDDTKTIGVGAFIGQVASSTIELNGCQLTKSLVEGGHWTGGLIGYTTGSGTISVVGCSVGGETTEEKVTIQGKGSVGAINGHAAIATTTTVTDSSVKNCTLTSYNTSDYRVGVVVGTANVGKIIINGTTSENNTLKQMNGDTEITRPEGQSDLYGRAVIEEENSSLKVDGQLVAGPKGKVAAIGDTFYGTFEEAVGVVQNGETITLLDNVKLGNTKVTLSVDATIDLNGKTLSASTTTNSNQFITSNSSEVVFKNGRVDISDVNHTGDGIFMAQSKSTMTFDNVKITNDIEDDGIPNPFASGYGVFFASGGNLSFVNKTEINLAEGMQRVITGSNGCSVIVDNSTITVTKNNGAALGLTDLLEVRNGSVITVTDSPNEEGALHHLAGSISDSTVAITGCVRGFQNDYGRTLTIKDGSVVSITNNTKDIDFTLAGDAGEGTAMGHINLEDTSKLIYGEVYPKGEEQPDDYNPIIDNRDPELEPEDPIVPPTSSSSGGGFTGVYNYPVEAPEVDGATVTLSDDNAVAGETVTITVTPDEGKQVNNVIVTDADGDVIVVTKVGANQYTFTMPEGKVNIVVTTKTADYNTTLVLKIDSPYITVNGTTVKNDVAPIVNAEGRTMLPIRVIAAALGADVDWNPELQKVTITKDGTVVEIFIGKYFAYVNGEIVKLDTAAFIDNSRTYLQIRFISELLGCDVDWDAVTRTVTIQGNK